jgi:Ca-activated chloride channel homolog
MMISRHHFLSFGLLLLTALRLPTGGVAQDAPPSSAKPVRLEVTVTASDNPTLYVAALSKDQLTLLDEQVPQEIVSFGQLDQPMSIGLVFDMSSENYASLLASTKEAFLSFIKASEKVHEYFLVGFDSDAYLAADWIRTPKQVADGFDKLATVKPSKKRAFYDALLAALVKVGTGSHPKRVIILISDGRDNGSKLKREELFNAVRKSDALVYDVSAKSGNANFFDSSDYETLNKLCSISGGVASYPRSGAEFYEFFDRLSVELKNQYTVSFIPGTTGHSGEWRRLRFIAKTLEFKNTPSSKNVKKMHLSVRSREGYYNR